MHELFQASWAKTYTNYIKLARIKYTSCPDRIIQKNLSCHLEELNQLEDFWVETNK